jgi:ribosomal protein L37AE/L43A
VSRICRGGVVSKEERNALFIPEAPAKKMRGCPKCEHPEFEGRKVGGVITFTCRKCKNQWSGGGFFHDADPHVPQPTSSYIPPSRYEPALKPGGDPLEVLRHVDSRPDFRRGALIPADGDE